MTPEEILAAANEAAELAPVIKELPPMIPGLNIHIDGDYLAYYAAGDDEVTPGEARQRALSIIARLKAMSGADRTVVHTGASGSHKGERFLIASVKPYQQQRDGGRKPKNHAYLMEWMQGYEGPAFISKVWSTRETDDGIAYMAQWHSQNDPLGFCVIASADKDMRMLPGVHIEWKTNELIRVFPKDFCVMSKKTKVKAGVPYQEDVVYGTKWFWLQMLCGDSADNIPGLEGFYVNNAVKKMGPATANAALKDSHDDADAFEIVMSFYENYYGEDACDRFAEQAALLWLRRDQHAAIDDFQNYFAFDYGGTKLTAAFARLKERVHVARATLNEIVGS